MPTTVITEVLTDSGVWTCPANYVEGSLVVSGIGAGGRGDNTNPLGCLNRGGGGGGSFTWNAIDYQMVPKGEYFYSVGNSEKGDTEFQLEPRLSLKAQGGSPGYLDGQGGKGSIGEMTPQVSNDGGNGSSGVTTSGGNGGSSSGGDGGYGGARGQDGDDARGPGAGGGGAGSGGKHVGGKGGEGKLTLQYQITVAPVTKSVAVGVGL